MSAVPRLELHLSYTCDQHCRFCSEAERMRRFRRHPVGWGMVAETLEKHARRGVLRVHFTGGEPTFHRHLERALRLSRALGMATSLGTNGGRILADGDALLPLVDEVVLSLHGPGAAVHDGLTGRPGSFDRAVGAAARVRAAGVALFVNTVVTRATVGILTETAALAGSLGARLFLVSHPTPEGDALDGYPALVPSFAELARELPRAPAAAAPAVTRFFGLPMCVLRPHEAASNDLHWEPRVTVEWVERPGSVAFDAVVSRDTGRLRTHVAPCERCSRRGVCPGVPYPRASDPDLASLRPFGGEGA